jgi:hypothetical protein
LQLRTLPCKSGTPARPLAVAVSRPGLEPGPGPSEGPMQSATPSGFNSPKSRRLDSHQHQPVYKTGAFLSRATSASTSARSRTPSASFGGWLLSQEHPGILGRGWRDRTPLAYHQSTVFETARRPFTGTLCTKQVLVPEERLALSLPKELVSKTSAYSFRHSGMEHRSGLEPDKSGFAIRRLDRFGIQCSKTTKLGWGGRTRTFERSGQSRVQWPLCYSPISWLREPVSSRPLCLFRAALSPD